MIKKNTLPLHPFFLYIHILIVLWCNGSTPVFGAVCPGSNPGGTTIYKHNLLKFSKLCFFKDLFKNLLYIGF